MTIPEIRLVKHLTEIAWDLDAKELLNVYDRNAFEILVRRHADPKLMHDMRDKQISHCIAAAFAEVHRK
jgi:hypothetical protein